MQNAENYFEHKKRIASLRARLLDHLGGFQDREKETTVGVSKNKGYP